MLDVCWVAGGNLLWHRQTTVLWGREVTFSHSASSAHFPFLGVSPTHLVEQEWGPLPNSGADKGHFLWPPFSRPYPAPVHLMSSSLLTT